MKYAIIVILIALAGAGFWYQKIHLPEQAKMAEMQRELAKLKKEEEEAAKKAEKAAAKAAAEAEKEEAEKAVAEAKPEPAPEPVEEKTVAAVEEKPAAEEESEYGSKLEERDAKLAELRAQLDAKTVEFQKRMQDLQDTKATYEANYANTRGRALEEVRKAEDNLRNMQTQMSSGSIRKSANDQAKLLEPYETAANQAKANLQAVEQKLNAEKLEIDKAWNQYHSDRKIMEANYRAAVSKVLQETR